MYILFITDIQMLDADNKIKKQFAMFNKGNNVP